MAYPRGPLLQALAHRVLENVKFIQSAAESYDRTHTKPPFSDTQLLISLLAVMVFPQERATEALGNLLSRYDGLKDVVKLRYSECGGEKVIITDAVGDDHELDPKDIAQLPRLLRNSIAHFNIRPIEEHGRFAGIRVWNEDRNGRITMIADLQFDRLRPLAEFVLPELSRDDGPDYIQDPDDPLEAVQFQSAPVDGRRKPPRIIETPWSKLLTHFGGDYVAAQTHVQRLISDEVKRLSKPPSTGLTRSERPLR